MNSNATNSTNDVDVILMLVDVSKESRASDKYVIAKIDKLKCPIILVLNKIDTKSKLELLPIISYYNSLNIFKEIIPVSALKKDNLLELIKVIKNYLPEGPRYYPVTMQSDHSLSFNIAEIVREKIFINLEEELPYSIGVYSEEITETNQKIKARVIVLVSRESQKGIIIGEKGLMLNKILKEAKLDLKKSLKKDISLEIYVKVYKNWRNSPSILKMLGYEIND